MRRLAIAACLAAASLSACADGLTPPSSVSNRTALDERAGTLVTLAYSAATRAGRISRQARIGPLADDAAWARFQALDRQAFALVEAIRTAYEAGNRDNYDRVIADGTRLACQLAVAAGVPRTC